jgi:hypothetical protein
MAVAWLLAGESPRDISNRLGHRSNAFTLDIYTAVTPDWQGVASERISRYLEDLAGTQNRPR